MKKRKIELLLIVFCIIAGTLIAGVVYYLQANQPRPLDPPRPRMADISTKYADVPYCEGQKHQNFDMYLPKNHKSLDALPVVIYVHGGGWSSGDKASAIVDYFGRDIVMANMAFASINYRLAPEFRYPTQNKDVACAIETIANHADEYNINPGLTFLYGDSAGGLLALMYGLSEKPAQVAVRGVVSFYGTTDLVYQLNRKQYRNQNASNYLGKTDDATARRASPLYQKSLVVPPVLFFHGDQDTMVSMEQAHKLYEKLKAVEPRCEFVSVKNAGHGFSDRTIPSRRDISETMLGFLKTLINEQYVENSGTVFDEYAAEESTALDALWY